MLLVDLSLLHVLLELLLGLLVLFLGLLHGLLQLLLGQLLLQLRLLLGLVVAVIGGETAEGSGQGHVGRAHRFPGATKRKDR